MDSSRRAVEAYWRSRLIDAVTSDEDKVAPVYKLEAVCNLLRTSHVSFVREVSEYILKRLDHKSPIVKQKALRLIKYAVGKSGVEFRREMQRHSVAMRQLFHYQGQMDPLKGDAPNKAVRDTAHEAVSALFASEEKLVPADENVNRRMEGFGNTNLEVQTEDRKSILSEVVAIGSSSIKQGLSTLGYGELIKNDSGSYRSPDLHRSLTTVKRRETWGSSGGINNLTRSWSFESKEVSADISTNVIQSQSTGKSPEDRLLETIVTSGGVRLRPTRDAIQNFLKEAAKLDAFSLCLAIESKLQSNVWQVRMKAACVLEAILRRKDGDFFSFMASYFSENRNAIIKCSETTQASVREKANEVLALLYENRSVEGKDVDTASNDKASSKAPVQLPDLIDTDDIDSKRTEDPSENQNDESFTNSMSASQAVNDLFRVNLVTESTENSIKIDGDDPFSDVSFHTNEIAAGEPVNDLFSGLVVDDSQSGGQINKLTKENQSGSFDIFGDNFAKVEDSLGDKKDLDDLMSGLSMKVTGRGQQAYGIVGEPSVESMTSGSNNSWVRSGQNDILNGLLNQQQADGINPDSKIPLGSVRYGFPPNIVFCQEFASQHVNYSAKSGLVSQQQLLAAMTNFQRLGDFQTQGNVGHSDSYVGKNSGYSSALPDMFQTHGYPAQSHNIVTESSKKEDSAAFDFISDHISAARDKKRVM